MVAECEQVSQSQTTLNEVPKFIHTKRYVGGNVVSDMNQLEHSDGFRVIKNERCPDCLTTDELLGDRLNDNRNSAVVFPLPLVTFL